jgi:thioredoxin 2
MLFYEETRVSEQPAPSMVNSHSDSVIIACPVDAALNRVPKDRLGQDPKCGTCHNRLFPGKAVEMTSANFERHTLKSELPVVIDFWAAWCGPCRTMSPNFEAAAKILEPRVRMAKLDTEAAPEISGRYAIRSIPTMIMIHKGREIARTSGAMPTQAIVQWIGNTLAQAHL